jgi:hypothetical protein
MAMLEIIVQHNGVIQEISPAATGTTNLVLYFSRQ